MNVSIFYIDDRTFTSGKYCIRAIGIGCNIAAFDVDLTTVGTEYYCVLTTEITIIIACRIACFIEYAVFDGYDCFIFADERILI